MMNTKDRRPIPERLLAFYTEDEAERWLAKRQPQFRVYRVLLNSFDKARCTASLVCWRCVFHLLENRSNATRSNACPFLYLMSGRDPELVHEIIDQMESGTQP